MKYVLIIGTVLFLALLPFSVQQSGAAGEMENSYRNGQQPAGIERESEEQQENPGDEISAEEDQSAEMGRELMIEEEAEPFDEGFQQGQEDLSDLERQLLLEKGEELYDDDSPDLGEEPAEPDEYPEEGAEEPSDAGMVERPGQ